MTEKNIPLLDFRDLQDPVKRPAFIETLGKGLEEFGFVAIEGHGVDSEVLERAYRTARETFGLEDAVKRQYERPEQGRQRGYTAFGVEHAKDSDKPDLKEFWHVGPQFSEAHPLVQAGELPLNVFPKEVPQFEDDFMALFGALEGFGKALLEAIGEYLELPAGFFGEITEDGNNVLRVIHYPDMGKQVPVGAVRAAAHEDINLITVLPASTRPGLELMTRDGEWMAIATPPGVMVCDTGDMMQLLTAGRLPATTHRVVNPEASDGGRLSMPFFMHPRPDVMIEPLDPNYAEPIMTRDFLMERLRAIGVS